MRLLKRNFIPILFLPFLAISCGDLVTDIYFKEDFNGSACVVFSKNCYDNKDSILVNDKGLCVTNHDVSKTYEINGVKFTRFWQLTKDGATRIPEYPDYNENGVCVRQLTSGVNKELFTMYIVIADSTWGSRTIEVATRNRIKRIERLGIYLDSLVECGCEGR